MIKLFVTDLDGTLLGKGNNINPKDIDAIHSLALHDIDFAVATGRLDREIIDILTSMDKKGHRVSQNGSFVHDQDGNCLYQQTFPIDLSKRLHDAILNKTSDYFISTSDEIHVPKKNTVVKLLEKVLYFPVTETPALAKTLDNSVQAAKYSIYGKTENIVALQAEIQQQFDAEIESYLSDSRIVEIVPKGVSKANGLAMLLKKLKIKNDEIAVIGDSFNDIPMLEMTPHSYVMSRAHNDVKQKANKVVDHVHQAITDLKEKQLVPTN